MRLTSLFLAAATLVALSLGTPTETAAADSITVDGIEILYPTGAGGSIPGGTATNEIFDEADGYYGATFANAAGGEVTYTYIGAEAGYTNEFYVDGDLRFTHSGTAFGTSYASNVSGAGDNLDFAFRYNVNGSPGLVSNGSNPNDVTGSANQNFFVAVLTSSQYSTYLGQWLEAGVYLALDDGGAGPDDNHDDMVIRVSAVPEPGSIALLGLGLAGLAFGARRRRTRISA